MFKFTTLYRQVDDSSAVDDFFSGTHLPLAEQLEGLFKSEVGRIGGKPGGESRYYLMYELYFTSEAAYRQAMVSEVGLQLMQALKPWDDARIITWFYAETFEEETRSPAL
ncbi:MAG: EthD family reductase [Chloroflexota bacterium]